MDKSKLTELLRYAWLEGRTNGLQNNGKSFSEFLELKEVSKAINYSQCCKSDSELLNVSKTNPNFEEWLKTHEKFKDNSYVWGMGYVMSYADMKAKHKELIELNI